MKMIESERKYYEQKAYHVKRCRRRKEVVTVANQCDFDIDVYYNRTIIDAKSILGVLSLDLTQELTVDYAGSTPELESFLDQHARLSGAA